VGQAGDLATTMSRSMREGAATAEYMVMMIWGQLVALLAEIAFAIAMAKWTFGASLNWIPMFQRLRSLLIGRILMWAISTAVPHQIIAQLFASLDSIIQRIQIDNGTRDHHDANLTSGAHIGAAISGIVSAFLSTGLSALLSRQFRTFLNTALRNLRGLPPPPRTAIPTPNPGRNTPTGPPIRNMPDPDLPPGGGPGGGPTPPPGGGGTGRNTPTPPAREAWNSINEDLAEVLTRNRESLAVPYDPNRGLGELPWQTAGSATAFRNDLADVFRRNFGPEIGDQAARRLGENYAETFMRQWGTPDLVPSLQRTLADSGLPPGVNRHLAETVPETLLTDINRFGAHWTTQLNTIGGDAAINGALAGYTGDLLANGITTGEWKADPSSAFTGAVESVLSNTITSAMISGIDHLGRPDLDTELNATRDRLDSTPPPEYSGSTPPPAYDKTDPASGESTPTENADRDDNTRTGVPRLTGDLPPTTSTDTDSGAAYTADRDRNGDTHENAPVPLVTAAPPLTATGGGTGGAGTGTAATGQNNTPAPAPERGAGSRPAAPDTTRDTGTRDGTTRDRDNDHPRSETPRLTSDDTTRSAAAQDGGPTPESIESSRTAFDEAFSSLLADNGAAPRLSGDTSPPPTASGDGDGTAPVRNADGTTRTEGSPRPDTAAPAPAAQNAPPRNDAHDQGSPAPDTTAADPAQSRDEHAPAANDPRSTPERTPPPGAPEQRTDLPVPPPTPTAENGGRTAPADTPRPLPAKVRLEAAQRLQRGITAALQDSIGHLREAQRLNTDLRRLSPDHPDTTRIREQITEHHTRGREADQRFATLSGMQSRLLHPPEPVQVMMMTDASYDTPALIGQHPSTTDPDLPQPTVATSSDAPEPVDPPAPFTDPDPDPDTTARKSPEIEVVAADRDQAPEPARDHEAIGPTEHLAPIPTVGDAPPTPPTVEYDGSLDRDHEGTSYDLDYLVTSRLMGPHLLRTERVPDVVSDALDRNPAGEVPQQVRDGIRDALLERAATTGLRTFFRARGDSLSVPGPDGRMWQVDLRLRSDKGEYHHMLTEQGGDATEILLTRGQERAHATKTSSSGTQRAPKSVAVRFTVSPLFLGTVGNIPIGPTFGLGGGLGVRSRTTGRGGTTEATSGITSENPGQPEAYVSDLRVSITVMRPADPVPDPDTAPSESLVLAPDDAHASEGAPAPPPRHPTTWAYEGLVHNGLAMILSGRVRVTPETAPGITFPRQTWTVPAERERTGGDRDRASEQDGDGTRDQGLVREGDTARDHERDEAGDAVRDGSEGGSEDTVPVPRRRTPYGGLTLKVEEITPDPIVEEKAPAPKRRWWNLFGKPDTTPGKPPEYTEIGTWLADRLAPLRPGDPGHPETTEPPRKLSGSQKRRLAFREQVIDAFGEDVVREHLHAMGSNKLTVRFQDADGETRTAHLWTSPTEYEPLKHSPHLDEFTRFDTLDMASSSNTSRGRNINASGSAGMSLAIPLPGGHTLRLDLPTFEYSFSNTRTTRVDHKQSGSRRTLARDIADNETFASYRVKRDFFLQLDGEGPLPHRFQGTSVELVPVREARRMREESVSSPEDTREPSLPHLRGDTVTDLSGVTVRDFDWSAEQERTPETPEDAPKTAREGRDTPQGEPGERDAEPAEDAPARTDPPAEDTASSASEDAPARRPLTLPRDSTVTSERSVYEQLAFEVLTQVARIHPGMVIPELARNRSNYAYRPDRPDGENGYTGWRDPRESWWPLRRNRGKAWSNTDLVMRTLTPANLRTRIHELTSPDGLAIELTEDARFDVGSMAKRKEFARPGTVTVRITADIGRLRYIEPATMEPGVRSGGGSELSRSRNKSNNHGLSLTAGAGQVRPPQEDARGMPQKMGGFSLTGAVNRSHGIGRDQRIGHTNEHFMFFRDGSDLWRAPVTFRARLHEYDGTDTVYGRDRSVPLLHEPLSAHLDLLVPRTRTTSQGRPETDPPPPVEALTSDEARELVQGNLFRTVPRPRRPWFSRRAATPEATPAETDPEGTGGRRDSSSSDLVPGARDRRDPAPAEDERTGGDTRRRADETVREPSPDPAPERTAEIPPLREEGTDPPPRESEVVPEPTAETAPEPAPDPPDPRDPRARARRLLDLGGAVEHIRTDFLTDQGRGLLGHTFTAFTGFRNKLRTLLSDGNGGQSFFRNLLSSEVLASSPAATSATGIRARQDLGRGWTSLKVVRATFATRIIPDGITSMLSFRGQQIWRGETTIAVAASSNTTTSVSVRNGLAAGGSGNPIDPPDPLPNMAQQPNPVGSVGGSWTPFSSSSTRRSTSSFSSSVIFVPKLMTAYTYRMTGTVTQAVELVKNWNLGPTMSLSTRFRGWRTRVEDLVSGYVSARDAYEANLIDDKVIEDAEGNLSVEPQPNPEPVRHVQVRPGFEGNGRRIRPADPTAALQALADRLATEGRGLELTVDARNDLLQALTSQLGNAAGNSVPIGVKLRDIRTDPDEDDPLRFQHRSHRARVSVEQRVHETEVEHITSADAVIETHTWKTEASQGEGRSTALGANSEFTALIPTDHDRDASPAADQRNSRPLFVPTAAGASASETNSRSTEQGGSESRTVRLDMGGPYVKLSQTTELILTIDDGRGLRLKVSADAGPVQTLYAYPYVEFGDGSTPGGEDSADIRPGQEAPDAPPAKPAQDDRAVRKSEQEPGQEPGDGTERPLEDTGAEGGDTAPEPTSPESPAAAPPRPEQPVPERHNTLQASLVDMVRTWTRNFRSDSGITRPADGVVLLPAAVGDGGRGIRDTAVVVVARSLGWEHGPNDIQDGSYTRDAVGRVRRFTADRLHLDRLHTSVEQSLEELALKALLPQALNSEEGAPLLSMGHTEWRIKAVPAPGRARVLDVSPGAGLNDTTGTGRSRGASSGHGTEQGGSLALRPAGINTYQPGNPSHAAVMGGALSSSSGQGRGTNQADGSTQTALPPVSEEQRLGPAYLVEFDATWMVGSVTEVPADFWTFKWVPRLAQKQSWNALRSGNMWKTLRSSSHVWGSGEVRESVSAWVSQSDAVRMGFLTRAEADALGDRHNSVHAQRNALADAEERFLRSRAALEEPVDRYRRAHEDLGRLRTLLAEAAPGSTAEMVLTHRVEDAEAELAQAREEYQRLEGDYEDALREYNTAVTAWTDTIKEVRAALASLGATAPKDGTTPATVGADREITVGRAADADRDDAAPAPAAPARTDLLDVFKSELNLTRGDADPRGDKAVEGITKAIDKTRGSATDLRDRAEATDREAGRTDTILDRPRLQTGELQEDGFRAVTGPEAVRVANWEAEREALERRITTLEQEELRRRTAQDGDGEEDT
ncbi:hypothetical protein ACJOT3_27515, partial [Nocardiopsis sp. frass1]